MEPLGEIKLLVIHHSQRDKDSLEFIKVKHKQNMGWEDIGYHYVIEKTGKLRKARSIQYQGAHVKGYNKNSIGICIVGNLDKKHPTTKQVKTLVKFLRRKMKKYNISLKRVVGHREFPGVTKTCPGKLINMNKDRSKLK